MSRSLQDLPTIDVITIFPDAVTAVLESSILRRAQSKGLLTLSSSDLRSYTQDKHRSVDDTPFGGGHGMLLKANVLEAALNDQLAAVGGDRSRLKVAFATPRGYRLDQKVFEQTSEWLGAGGKDVSSSRRLVIVCGRYEGVDERITERWVDLEFSLGDFIVTGGEIPALALVDGVVRLIPGVLGDDQSAPQDSFTTGLLEQPQYTKPREALGIDVPAELMSGNHKVMDEWKLRQSLLLTFAYRPDLIRDYAAKDLPPWAAELLTRLKARLDLRH